MNNIYGERCSVCGGFHNELEQGIDFSKEVLTKMLREIYDGLNVRDDIQRDAFEETLRIFNEATAEGLSASVQAMNCFLNSFAQITKYSLPSALTVCRMIW
jgi:hypothetical protein